MSTDICVQFGRRIRALRLKRGWRQIDLAAHAEIHKTHISDIEVGRSEVCLRTIERLAEALEVTPADLLK